MEIFAKTAESDLTCPVCLELFTTPHIPKDLPGCGHICCEVCLGDLVTRRRKQCPECRQVIQFPRGGVKKLRTNIRIRNLAEKFPKNTDYNNNVQDEPICVEHDDAKMRYYCIPCNKLCCQLCLLQNHQGDGHQSKSVKERYNEMQVMLKTCKTAIDDGEKNIHLMEEIIPEIHKSCQQREREITRCVNLHVSQIRKAGTALKKQIWTAGHTLIDEMSQQITSRKDHIGIVENKRIMAMENAGSVPEVDFIVTHSDFPSKVQMLEQNNKRLRLMQIPSVQCQLYGIDEEAYTPEKLGFIKQIRPAVYNRDDGKATAKFTFQKYNMSEMRTLPISSRVLSPAFLLQGIEWKILLVHEKPQHNRNPRPEDSYLGFYVECAVFTPPGAWACKTTGFMRLINQNGEEHRVHEMGMASFSQRFPAWGVSNFIKLKELMDHQNGFVKDDMAVFEVELTAETPQHH